MATNPSHFLSRFRVLNAEGLAQAAVQTLPQHPFPLQQPAALPIFGPIPAPGPEATRSYTAFAAAPLPVSASAAEAPSGAVIFQGVAASAAASFPSVAPFPAAAFDPN